MIHSFLLIGQSNMAGRGDVAQAQSIDTSRIKILRNGRWQPMYRPINADRGTSGVNLAESFAEAYAKQYGVDVGLIACADGGTTLEQWEEGGLLYDNAVYQAKLAQRTSTIAGVLWHQGESNCREGGFEHYKTDFEKIMKALRRDLDLYDVPFLLGGLGDFLSECEPLPFLKNYPIVNAQLQQIAQDNPMTCFISAEGITCNPDKLHFDSKGLYEFGLRYFDGYEKTHLRDKVFEEKPELGIRTEMERL